MFLDYFNLYKYDYYGPKFFEVSNLSCKSYIYEKYNFFQKYHQHNQIWILRPQNQTFYFYRAYTNMYTSFKKFQIYITLKLLLLNLWLYDKPKHANKYWAVVTILFYRLTKALRSSCTWSFAENQTTSWVRHNMLICRSSDQSTKNTYLYASHAPSPRKSQSRKIMLKCTWAQLELRALRPRLCRTWCSSGHVHLTTGNRVCSTRHSFLLCKLF